MRDPDSFTPLSETGALPSLIDRLRPLRVALAVVRHGSTVRASEAIHLSQSAVARAIAELEKACGLLLFERGPRGMIATPAGSRLVERVEMLLQHLASGASEAVLATPPEGRTAANLVRFPSVVTPAELRALVAIAGLGSEAAAGTALGLTQPAVHHALQGLERLLGVRLFVRLSFGTRLTPAAEALLRRVKLALAEIKAMEVELGAWRGEYRGRVSVGVLPLSVGIFLPRAVESLHESHPGIEVRIVDGTYESLVQQLLCAEIDVIAGALRRDASAAELRQWPLFDDDLVVVARKGHPCLTRPLKSLADLAEWDWVTPLPGTPAERALQQVFSAQGVPLPERTLQVGSPSLTLAFVMQTDRLALASCGQAVAESAAGGLGVVPLKLSATARPIGLATRAVGLPSPDLTLFIQACGGAVEQPHHTQR